MTKTWQELARDAAAETFRNHFQDQDLTPLKDRETVRSLEQRVRQLEKELQELKKERQ